MQRNPSLVQHAPPSKKHATPLILIHDGGGTTFSYHCLRSLQRTVYAIQNPRFYSGRAWNGEIAAMARVYADLIRMVVPEGKVLLGGWSLGGLIALEIASVLGQTSALTVVGVLMVDSIYPGALKERKGDVVAHAPILSNHCKPEIRMLVANMMKASSKMVESWIMPIWSSRPSLRTRRISKTPFHSTWSGHDSGYATGNESDDGKVCLNFSQLQNNYQSLSRSFFVATNVAREDRLLGWEDYDCDLMCAVLDIPGHHFNLFAESHIEQTGKRMMEGCDLFEKLHVAATANIPDAIRLDLF